MKLCTRILFLSLPFVAGIALLPEQARAQDDPNVDNTVGTDLPLIMGPRSGGNSTLVITATDGYDNFDLGTTNAEPHMATNPLNPQWFFNAFNTNTTFHTENGTNWTSNDPGFPTAAGDPVAAYDSLGNLYYETMKSPITGCWVVKSTNNGLTWGTAVSAVNGNDKNWMACDQTMGPYANYVYTTMTPGNFARSTDGGATFQTTTTVTNGLPGMMVAVGPNVLNSNNISGGCVYVVTHTGTNAAGVYTFRVSTDGGATFTQQSVNQFSNYIGTEISGRSTVQGMRCRPYPMIAADNSYGPNRGRLYLVYTSNNPSGNGNKSDIFLRYSTDQGTTWSPSVVANDDSNSQNNFQFHPAIWCDKETGRLYIKFYDTRRVPTSDSMDVYATYTDDGGATFAPNQRLTNRTFRINFSGAGGPTYRGDYDAITSNKHTSMSVWTDFRNSNYLGMTAYFPDFAMLLSRNSVAMTGTDSTTVNVIVPSVKLYTGVAKFSATVSPAAPFTFSFVGGRDSLTAYPDSVTLRIRSSNVTAGTYTVTVAGSGPNGTPVHRRTITVNVNFIAQGWTPQTSGVSSYLYSVKAVNQSTAWAAGAGGVVLRTTNGGLNWSSVGGGNIGAADIYNIDALNDSVAFVTTTPATSTYIFRTTNRGSTWDTVYTQSGGFIDAIKMYNNNNGVAVGDPADTLWTILRTSNGGASWARIATEPLRVGGEAGTQNGLSVYVPPVGQITIWFNSGVGGRIYRSSNGGATWSSGTAPFTATSNVWFINNVYGVATGSTANGVARSTDGGITWASTPVAGTGFLIACGGAGTSDFWYARGTTIYRSTDRGASFTSAYTGTGSYVGLSFVASSGNTYGWAVTSTGGIAAFNGVVTDVPGQQQPARNIPEQIALMQNYPNPFNPTTTISYALETHATVQLKIFNMLGQEITTLVDAPQPGGSYSVNWDGNSDTGILVSSGIYFYRLEATTSDGKIINNMKKMVLLK